MPTLHDALALANAGWEVLPLNGKVPITRHGVKDASADEHQVRAWWSTPNAAHNIGARVPSTLVVLDIDPQNAGSLDALSAAAGGHLPDTLTVHTGRGGGGRHLYFHHPGGRLTSTRLPPGIDVKTHAGYCVMPPSLHPATGLPYRWETRPPADLPPTLRALLQPPEPIRAPRPATEPADASSDRLARRALYLARFVEQRTEGGRNAGLFWAACRAVEDGHPVETFELLEGAALVAGLTEAEARRTIASARHAAAGA